MPRVCSSKEYEEVFGTKIIIEVADSLFITFAPLDTFSSCRLAGPSNNFVPAFKRNVYSTQNRNSP